VYQEQEPTVTDPVVIECVGLTKQYLHRSALNGLDLRVPAGSIFGFLGRNGAGKTTTIKVLLGMVHPTQGNARVFDLPAGDPAASVAIRQRTGFVSEDKDLYDFMTVEEIIDFTARFYPRWRRDLQERYVRSFELPLDARVKSLSRGGRTKLALLLAFCRGADLLILDEPTSGLDPVVADEVQQLLVGHVARGDATIFLSSHQLAEIEQVADRVGVIDRGRMVMTGVLDDMRQDFRRVQAVFADDAPDARLRASGVVRVKRHGRVLTITASGHVEDISAEARTLGAVSVDVSPMSLKDMFLELVAVEE
jgi:ABC-2 type transport system ATP-binding protein